MSPLKAKLDSEVRKLVRGEHDATTALLATRAVPGMLGADGPRRYLVLFENPAESRASGGVIGDFAEVTAVDGRLSLVKVGSVGELDSSGNPAGKHLIGPRGLPRSLQPVRTGGLLGERADVTGLPVGG